MTAQLHPPPALSDFEALERRIAELELENQALRAELEPLRVAFEAAPYIISLIDVAGSRLLTTNSAGTSISGRPTTDWIGKTIEELFPPETAREVRRRLEECVTSRRVAEVEEYLEIGAGQFWMNTLYIPVEDASGAVTRVLITSFDITERKRESLEAQRQQDALIELQSASLAELSTPLLAIHEGVVVMPLVGAIDSRRAVQILETLLSGVSEKRAAWAILDITGVAVVDTQVASALIRAAQAASLLGTRVILTGIRPEIAQTLVGLGTDLSSVVTQGSLQSGVAMALRQLAGGQGAPGR